METTSSAMPSPVSGASRQLSSATLTSTAPDHWTPLAPQPQTNSLKMRPSLIRRAGYADVTSSRSSTSVLANQARLQHAPVPGPLSRKQRPKVAETTPDGGRSTAMAEGAFFLGQPVEVTVWETADWRH